MKIFYTDDKTGKYSDTTLRTWLLFGLFFIYSILISCFAFFGEKPVEQIHLSILEFFGLAALGQGGLYLGKRINERTNQSNSKFEISENLLERIQKSRSLSESDSGDIRSKQL